ncbi:hypothetical protein FRC03_004791 [Tulasnella sp. 419]|nr:hypothetical protein FRC03_004791 [Tulasnella sp. 419]
MANPVRNYHPHIKPSVEEATPTAELRRVSNMTARDMLCNFLMKTRQERRKASGIRGSSDDAKLNRIIDTVLAKLHIELENVSQLRFLVDSSEDLAVQELEPLVISRGLFNVLATICEKEEGRLLDLWTKIVDGEWKDPSFNQNALQRIIETLIQCKDCVTVQRYGIWLAKHDAPAAMKLFISKRGMKLDDNLLLRAMRAVDIDVGKQYLEHLVLGRKNSEPALHEQLIQHYLDRLFTSLHNPEAITFWQEAALSHSSATRDAFSQPPSFLEHVASLSDMPVVRLRIKMALFLQGSTGYNVFTVRDRVRKSDEHELLGFERAILHGKIGNHKAALTLLVRTVHDSTSAEAYCTSEGEVVSNIVATVVGHQLGLDLRSNLVVSGGVSGLAISKNKAGKMERNISTKEAVDESKKKELLRILMEVHMARGDGAVHETARLLNSQTMNLDAYV